MITVVFNKERSGRKRTNSHVTHMVSIGLHVCIGAFLLLGTPNALLADEVELTAEIDQDEVRIAESFHLEIQVFAPAGTQVTFPEVEKSLGPFEVLSVEGKIDIPVSNRLSNERGWRQLLTLETLDTGRLQIPSVEVAVAEPGQPEQKIRTKPIAVNVVGVVEPSSDLTQFKGVADLHDVDLPNPASHRWTWIGSGIAVVGLFACGLVLMTKRRKKIVSPLAWASRRLNETCELPYAETIVRQFIEERLGCAATSLPPDKILAELRQLDVEDSVLQSLDELLRQSEQMKFGGLELSQAEQDRLVNLASKLVKQLDENGEGNE